MLPSSERITKNREIQAILRKKQLIFTSPLLRIVAQVNKLNTPRVVVVCPKSLGPAVKRNRTRRRILGYYTSIRHKIGKNIDMILFPRSATGSWAKAEELEKALKKWDCIAE